MVVNEKPLRKILRELAITGVISDEDTTVSASLPISPSLHSTMQLSSERPPVEDPSYLPMNHIELGRALQAIGDVVPDRHVKQFYTAVSKLFSNIPSGGVVGESIKK